MFQVDAAANRQLKDEGSTAVRWVIIERETLLERCRNGCSWNMMQSERSIVDYFKWMLPDTRQLESEISTTVLIGLNIHFARKEQTGRSTGKPAGTWNHHEVFGCITQWVVKSAAGYKFVTTNCPLLSVALKCHFIRLLWGEGGRSAQLAPIVVFKIKITNKWSNVIKFVQISLKWAVMERKRRNYRVLMGYWTK